MPDTITNAALDPNQVIVPGQRNGQGEQADRLVLTRDNDGADLGGWCQASVEREIQSAIDVTSCADKQRIAELEAAISKLQTTYDLSHGHYTSREAAQLAGDKHDRAYDDLLTMTIPERCPSCNAPLDSSNLLFCGNCDWQSEEKAQ